VDADPPLKRRPLTSSGRATTTARSDCVRLNAPIQKRGAAAASALGLRLGANDSGNDPAKQTTRKAYDLLANGFGSGFNGPLQLAVRLPLAGDETGLARLTSTPPAHRWDRLGRRAPAQHCPRHRRDHGLPHQLTAERTARAPRRATSFLRARPPGGDVILTGCSVALAGHRCRVLVERRQDSQLPQSRRSSGGPCVRRDATAHSCENGPTE